MVKLKPQDVVAMVSIGWDILIAIPLILGGFTMIGIVNLIVGVVIVIGVDAYEDFHKPKKREITWLDYLRIRDLMAKGQNYEAAIFALRKTYNLSEVEAAQISPEKFHEMMAPFSKGET